MKKIYLFLFLFLWIPSAISWESNLTIDCMNENLEKCSSSNMEPDESNKNSDIVLKKPFEKKKEVKKIIKEKIFKKEAKIKEKVFKKKVKNKEKTIKIVNVKNDNISFEEFKNLVINYSNTTGYPDIDN